MSTLIEKRPNYRKYEVLVDGSEDITLIAQAESNGWKLREVKVTENNEHRFLIFRPYSGFIDIDDDDNQVFDKQRWIDDFVKPGRKQRLLDSALMMAADIVEQMTPARYTEWKVYRQQLRDLPDQVINATSPEDITWPQKPSGPNIPELAWA